MNITPRSAKEIAEMGLLPKVVYNFEVRKAEDSKTGPNSKKPGTEVIKLELIIFTESGRKAVVRDMLHPSMEVKVFNFCAMAGLEDEYQSGTLKAHHCEGVSGQVKLKVVPEDEKNGYPAKNEVSDYVVPKAGGSKAATATNEEGDCIPF